METQCYLLWVVDLLGIYLYIFFNTDPEKKADHVKCWYESVNAMSLENIAETVLLFNV